jgi:hypothetical protein
MTPLLGFAPDVESTTPGMLVDCVQFIPYESGMEAAPSAQTPAGVPAVPAECLGAAVVTKLDDTRRILTGTATKIYELASGSWTDVSGATYTGGADTRWDFTQFGDATIAANRADILQRSTSGAFAAISGAPKAKIVYSVGGFVMALNVHDGAEKTNGWHCSAAFDDTDWTEAVSTQCASGLLVATPGPITAGSRLGEYAVAYKTRSIYIGQYVGAPTVWDWILVPGGEAGCIGQEAHCDIGGAHFFVGEDNFWIFDGTSPRPIGDTQVRQWFFDNSAPEHLYKTKCIFDKQQNRVWVFYPGAGATSCDSALVYHLRSKQWGRANRAIQAAMNYVSQGIVIDTMDTVAATIDALPNVSIDSPFWGSGTEAISVVNTSNQLQTLTGNPEASSLTTGDVGEDDAVTLLKQVRLRFSAGRGPTSATIEMKRKMNTGDGFTLAGSGTINDGKFDVLQSARWHRATVNFTGPVRVTGIRPMIEAAGER